MLDIGCGDGRLARATADRLGAIDVQGVDVLVRPGSLVPVLHYDGRTLPFPDQRFDVVTLCDVLHHAETPDAVLREALRVLRPQGRLIVKDHFRFGPWSHLILLAMDVVGNIPKGVLVRGRYMSGPEWMSLVAESGARMEHLIWPLQIHVLPWRLIARSHYQFAMRLSR
jgi:2-polyprenyl-3-methyl-5-hydroxy-6-metoxy-1,4-benzoquinol methylase